MRKNGACFAATLCIRSMNRARDIVERAQEPVACIRKEFCQ